MTWKESLTLIRQNIKVGTDLNPDSRFRKVVSYYNQDSTSGYRVQIGTKTSIPITISMLQTVFKASAKNGGIYNRGVFKDCYHKQVVYHPCHVHTVGQIFRLSGIMHQQDKRNYRIVEYLQG